jgi:electron transfer flavoprotein beta subunit
MKILVPMKRVVDPYLKIRVKSDESGVDITQLKMVINPFDEIALEEAIRLKEKGIASQVIVVSIGQLAAQDILRQGLALGADEAILVETDDSLLSIHCAKILKSIVEKVSPSLILMGKQAIDGDNNQTPQMLATLLNWRSASYASLCDYQDNSFIIQREVDAGLESVLLQLPAVVSVDLRLNTPRYASLPNIMKAKQKPLSIMSLTSLDLQLKSHQQIVKVSSPKMKTAGIKLDSVAMLVDKLRHEAKVID